MAGQQKTWLYYLIDAQGRSYRVENGIVLPKSSRRPLKHTPNAWQDISLGWERDIEAVGLTRKFSISLEFMVDGAQILRHLFYSANFEQRVYLLIQKQFLNITNTRYFYYYDFFYKGEVDFTTIQDEEDKIRVKLEEAGLRQLIDANINTVYEIALNVSDAIAVRMDGAEFMMESSFLIANIGLDGAGNDLNFDLRNHFVALIDITNDNGAQISSQPVNRVKFLGTNADLPGNENWFFKATVATSVHLEWNFKIGATVVPAGTFLNPSGRTIIQIQVMTVDGTVDPARSVTIFNGLLNASGNLFTGSADIPVQPGEYLYFRTFFSVIGAGGDANIKYTYFDIPDSLLKITATYIYPVSHAKALRPMTLGQALVDKITGTSGVYKFRSSVLSGQWDNLVTTSGDGLRSFETAAIKTNMASFLKSYSAVISLGYGVEGKDFVVEKRDYFLDPSNPLPLGATKEMSTRIATEIMANVVKVGYPVQTYDNLNGRYEFNTTHTYTSEVTRITRVLDLVSDYRGDHIGIELVRINLEGRKSTDNAADNDVFFLHINNKIEGYLTADNTPVYHLLRETYTSITGVPSDKIFNRRISPKYMLLNHIDWINSIFYGFEGSKLVFQSADKNAELSTVTATETVIEKAPITINNVPRLFKPLTFDFKPETPEALVEILDLNPNRCFSFVHRNGKTYKGFTMSIGIAPNTLQEQAFLLLSTPDNDLTTLAQ